MGVRGADPLFWRFGQPGPLGRRIGGHGGHTTGHRAHVFPVPVPVLLLLLTVSK
jgi:hypothetical protein